MRTIACVSASNAIPRPVGPAARVTNPTKAVVNHTAIQELLARYEGQQISYYNGVMESHHQPHTGGGRFEIAGDAFMQRYVVRTPIDGYGPPSIYLSLLREVCSNGMIGEHRAFRSVIAVGKGQDNVTYSLQRALDGFHNDEGYAALRQRFQAAASSWASVHETNGLYNLLAKLSGGAKLGNDGASLLDARSQQPLMKNRAMRNHGRASRLRWAMPGLMPDRWRLATHPSR